ncbi:hypothetical protein, partial [Mesorhizobium sp. M7A.F.Ca.CA.004.04.2.1]|uniref:hypothetical protein n=1 Tax=Mesorhizobium sp. M7A.F.Ca.CA.004.04.2.1 TaxID=2496677 RepID=UPI0019D49367
IFQLARFLRDRDGGGRLHAGKGVGKKGHELDVSMEDRRGQERPRRFSCRMISRNASIVG